MSATTEVMHLVIFAFFLAAAYKATIGKVKGRLTTLVMSLLLALPSYLLLEENVLHLDVPYYPWGAVLPLSIGVVEALRVRPRTKRVNIK
jgi:peptidoglycan/LPS O-acetylase OafA/YrhL